MVNPDPQAATLFWQALTRLGEAQLLLPVMLAASLWLLLQPRSRRLALGWLGGTAAAASLTTASKVAFIGYGLGWAAADFTGFSGHAMFAAAVLPPLLHLVLGGAGNNSGGGSNGDCGDSGGGASGNATSWGVLAGYALAAAVAVSRVMVQAHSWSEVVTGFALGAAASAFALGGGRPLPALRGVRWLPLALLLAFALLGVAGAPPSRTHDWVTRLALAQSGRSQPYQRWQLHQRSPWQQLQQAFPGRSGPPAPQVQGRATPSLQTR